MKRCDTEMKDRRDSEMKRWWRDGRRALRNRHLQSSTSYGTISGGYRTDVRQIGHDRIRVSALPDPTPTASRAAASGAMNAAA